MWISCQQLITWTERKKNEKRSWEYVCMKTNIISTSEKCCVWIAGTPFSAVNCCSSQQSPAALSNLSKIPCSVKGTSSAASPLSGQGLQETGEPIQQPPEDLWASVKHQPLSLPSFQKSCALLVKSQLTGSVFADMSTLKHCSVRTDFPFHYVSLKISLEDSPGQIIKK